MEPNMHQYRMIERLMDDDRCVFRCNKGRYHVARVLKAIPPTGVPLSGYKPHIGFGILVGMASGAIFRVIFESINESNLAFVPGQAQHLPPSSLRANGTAFRSAN